MEGRYQMNRFADDTDETAEAGTAITNPRSFGNNKESDKNESRHPEVKRRFPGFTKNLYEYFVEYSTNTTIQGISYVGEQSRSIVERLTWIILFCMSLYFCIGLIIESYKKWDTSPVLISFSTSPTKIYEVPFPAVTICPETKTRASVYNYTRNYNKKIYSIGYLGPWTEEEEKHLHGVSMVCAEDDFGIFDGTNTTIGYDTIEFLIDIAPQFNELMYHCRYPLSNDTTCQSLFIPILTDVGICYSFNMLDRREVFRDNVFTFGKFMSHKRDSGGWTLEKGYKENTPIDAYPGRMIAAGSDSQFIISLQSLKENLDYICTEGAQGYKIILHNPAETPKVTSNYIPVSHDHIITIAIKPDMMSTSKGLKSYDPHRRRCYFSEERYLAFYRSYTQANCEQECLTNYTLTKCGCVAFTMPHEKETPLCGLGKRGCMQDAKDELLRREFISVTDKKEAELSSKCDCLPGCISLVYKAEAYQVVSNTQKMWKGYDPVIADLLDDKLFTTVNMFFKEGQFIKLERNELWGSTDFLSSCGGILGLFTGFSFLSLVEILYFLSLRLFCNVKRYGKHYWSGSQELVNSDQYDHQK